MQQSPVCTPCEGMPAVRVGDSSGKPPLSELGGGSGLAICLPQIRGLEVALFFLVPTKMHSQSPLSAWYLLPHP